MPANTGKRRNSGSFVKGDPRINRKGNPGSISIVSAIKRQLKAIDPKDKRMFVDILAEKIVRRALEDVPNGSDVTMARDIVDRIDGKPKQDFGVSVTRPFEDLTDDDLSALLLSQKSFLSKK